MILAELKRKALLQRLELELDLQRGLRLLLLCICMFVIVIFAARIESQADVRLGVYLQRPPRCRLRPPPKHPPHAEPALNKAHTQLAVNVCQRSLISG